MGWFEHRHYWRNKTDTNKVIDKEGRTTKCLLLEDCVCGAVRTIEYGPGEPAVVRIATHIGEKP